MSIFKELNQLIDAATADKTQLVKAQSLGQITHKTNQFSINSFVIGSDDPKAPTFGLFGGVHGLEQVGTQVCIAFLQTLIQQLQWDEDLQKKFKDLRLISIPMINPVGMNLLTRANGNGVDLMRNAPIEGNDIPFLVGGQTLSPKLWWYRGKNGMEKEVQILTQFVRKHMFQSQCALALDCHSGFGMKDRLWYPYAKTKSLFPKENECRQFHSLLNRTYPYHVYHVESQSKSYTTHGDVWDFLFDEFTTLNKGSKIFIPWTLEMGSWLWVKKNPFQVFSILGPFNPMKDHRIKRTLRRHLLLFDFFLSAVKNPDAWCNETKAPISFSSSG